MLGLLIRMYLRGGGGGNHTHKITKVQVFYIIFSTQPKGLLEVTEYHLEPEELVRIIALKIEALVAVQMFPQHLHDCIYNHLYYIALFNQLSGLKRQTKKLNILSYIIYIYIYI